MGLRTRVLVETAEITFISPKDYTPWWMRREGSQPKCKNLTPQQVDELFFPGSGGKPHKAREYCSTCPLRDLCLSNAISNDLKGFHAGTTDEERKAMKVIITDQITRLLMPEEPDRTERKKYLHVVVVPDPRKWMDELEPSDEELQVLDTVDVDNPVWDLVV